jgi:hypothetical protein
MALIAKTIAWVEQVQGDDLGRAGCQGWLDGQVADHPAID